MTAALRDPKSTGMPCQAAGQNGPICSRSDGTVSFHVVTMRFCARAGGDDVGPELIHLVQQRTERALEAEVRVRLFDW